LIAEVIKLLTIGNKLDQPLSLQRWAKNLVNFGPLIKKVWTSYSDPP